MKLILCDVDGVLADMVGAVFKQFHKPYDPAKLPPGEYDLCRLLATPGTELPLYVLTDTCDNTKFWSEIPIFPWAKDLVTGLQSLGMVAFCSNALWSEAMCSPRVEWLRHHFGSIAPCAATIFASDKWHLARPDVLLVDDCDQYVRAFRQAGGKAVLFPQPWNSRHYESGNQNAARVLLECATLLHGGNVIEQEGYTK
jgi:5'(3')-deoxyribonucleotidase